MKPDQISNEDSSLNVKKYPGRTKNPGWNQHCSISSADCSWGWKENGIASWGNSTGIRMDAGEGNVIDVLPRPKGISLVVNWRILLLEATTAL